MRRYKYFTTKEVRGLSHEFVSLLDLARGEAKTSFIITSGKRKPGSKIGVNNSSHESGVGVDLRCSTSSVRYKILKGLYWVRFHRIGVYDRHIHVDNDLSKPRNKVWLGKSK